ncbi:MAG TPA: arginase family protein [Rubrobacter sp.]|nr:arginase family protein [Rubrobacter sp.]
MTRYEPADSFATPHFSGVRTFMRFPNARDLTNADDAMKACGSFDIDFVDPAYAPGTGPPQIGGYTSHEAQEFVRGLAGLDIVGCNVAHDSLGLLALREKGCGG